MKATELFSIIKGQLEKDGLMPDIIDYANASTGTYDEDYVLDTTELDIDSKLDYGGSEGIYLDLYILFTQEDGERVRQRFGVIKTLRDDREAMQAMGKLYGDFVYTVREYISEHWDDFMLRGYRIRPYMGDKEAHWTYPEISRDKLIDRINYCFSESDGATKGITKVIVTRNKDKASLTLNKSQYPVDEKAIVGMM